MNRTHAPLLPWGPLFPVGSASHLFSYESCSCWIGPQLRWPRFAPLRLSSSGLLAAVWWLYPSRLDTRPATTLPFGLLAWPKAVGCDGCARAGTQLKVLTVADIVVASHLRLSSPLCFLPPHPPISSHPPTRVQRNHSLPDRRLAQATVKLNGAALSKNHAASSFKHSQGSSFNRGQQSVYNGFAEANSEA